MTYEKRVLDAQVTSHSDIFNVSVSDYSVKLSFTREQVLNVPFVDVIVQFEDGTVGISHIVFTAHTGNTSYSQISLRNGETTVSYPNSPNPVYDSDFAILIHEVARSNPERFSATFISGETTTPLQFERVSDTNAILSFSSSPLSGGIVQLSYIGVPMWRFDISVG